MSPSETPVRGTRLVAGEGPLEIEDGVFELWPGFLGNLEASSYLAALRNKIDWHTPRVFVYGRWVDSPRQSAWYGDSRSGLPLLRNREPAQPMAAGTRRPAGAFESVLCEQVQ